MQGDAPALKQVAVFDYLVNNADRKASHFLKDKNGKLWLVTTGSPSTPYQNYALCSGILPASPFRRTCWQASNY